MRAKIALSLLLVCLSPFFLPGGFWYKYWYGQWGVLMALLSVVYAVWIGKRLHWTLVPLTLSTLLSALWVYGFLNQYSGMNAGDQAAIKNAAMYAAFSFTMLLFACVALKKHAHHFRYILGGLCLLATIWTLCQYHAIPFKRVGFVGNASMNGCLIAVTLPFLMHLLAARSNALTVLSTVIAATAICLTGTSVPVGVFCIVALILYLSKTTLFLVAFIVATACATQGHTQFMSSNGRFDMWRVFADWWWYGQSHWFGAGAGVSTVILPTVQKAHGINGGFYMWAHNDVLQVLLEQGYVGIAALLVAFLGVVTNARHDRALLASLFGWAASSVFNYPSHLPVHAAVGMMLVCMSFTKERV